MCWEGVFGHTIISRCPSFFRMDCNTVFPEIFRANVIHDLGSTQQSKIVTKYIQSSYCNNCVRTIRVNIEVFVHYVSLYQLYISDNTIQDWPNYIIKENLAGSLQCTRCEKLFNLTSSIFSWGNISRECETYHFSEAQEFPFYLYHYCQLVTQRIIYFNGLQDESMVFPSFQLFCRHIGGSCFCGIYS